MRRVGLVLAGLGTCLIVFAVLMPVWVSSKVLKFPLNEYATATLTASNVSYFSPTKLTELTGVNMEATYTIKGNAAAGSSSTAVWNQFIYVYDQTNKLPFQTMTRTFAFDRRTAQLINCCGANVNGDSSVEQTGIVGYVFPIGTKKQTYDVFDANLNKPMPFTYAGTDTINGIQAYRFEENVSPTQNGTQTLPGSLVGESQASVVLPQYYEMHLTYWIDPDTGALLNATEHETLTLHNSQGAQALLLLDANLAMTPASVNGLVALDNTQRHKMSLVTTILPLVTGIVGVIGLIVGILLSRRREDVEGVEGGASATSAELAAAEPEGADGSAQSATRPSLVPGLDDEPGEATAESPAVNQETAEPEAEAAAGTAAADAAAPAEAEAAEPEAAQAEAAQAEAAEASKAEVGEAPAADSAAAEAPPAEAPAAEAAPAEAPPAEAPPAEAPAAEAAPAEAEAAQPEASQTEVVEAPAVEATPAEAKADGPEAAAESETAEAEAKADSVGAPAADAPAPESQAAAESPKAEGAPAEAPTAEVSAATSASPEAAAANAPADAPATTSRRGRRGSHRR